MTRGSSICRRKSNVSNNQQLKKIIDFIALIDNYFFIRLKCQLTWRGSGCFFKQYRAANYIYFATENAPKHNTHRFALSTHSLYRSVKTKNEKKNQKNVNLFIFLLRVYYLRALSYTHSLTRNFVVELKAHSKIYICFSQKLDIIKGFCFH